LGGNYPFSAAYAYVPYHFNIRIIEPFCPYPKAEQAKHFIYLPVAVLWAPNGELTEIVPTGR